MRPSETFCPNMQTEYKRILHTSSSAWTFQNSFCYILSFFVQLCKQCASKLVISRDWHCVSVERFYLYIFTLKMIYISTIKVCSRIHSYILLTLLTYVTFKDIYRDIGNYFLKKSKMFRFSEISSPSAFTKHLENRE